MAFGRYLISGGPWYGTGGGSVCEIRRYRFNPVTIDYAFVTHAHIDYSGLLPLLYNNGLPARIVQSATCELCNIMLKDLGTISGILRQNGNRKAVGARKAGKWQTNYNMEDAQGVLEHFVPCTHP